MEIRDKDLRKKLKEYPMGKYDCRVMAIKLMELEERARKSERRNILEVIDKRIKITKRNKIKTKDKQIKILCGLILAELRELKVKINKTSLIK